MLSGNSCCNILIGAHATVDSNTPQSIPSGVETPIAFTFVSAQSVTVKQDTSTRFIVQRAGKYQISAKIIWTPFDGAGIGTRSLILTSGTVVKRIREIADFESSPVTTTTQSTIAEFNLQVGDVVTMSVMQDSGATMTVGTSFFMMLDA